MNRESLTKELMDGGIIAIVRADSSPDNVVAAVGAVLEGGVRCIEVTLTTSGAIDCIAHAAATFADTPLLLGVGSVIDAESCRAAIDSGAQYVVSPVIAPPVIEAAHTLGKPVLPGAYTPTEIFHAWQLGADIVKVFPAGFGGVSYIKAVRAPLPQIPLAPTGGVTVENVGDFIRAGAVALGVGSNLIGKELVASRDLATLRSNARAFQEALTAAREER